MPAAKPFRQLDAQRLEVREGGGCMALFGLPFLAAGVFMCLLVAGAIPLENADDVNGGGRFVLALMATAFTGVGGFLALGRRWIEIDRGRRMITDRKGLLVPMKSRGLPLRDFDAVRIGFDSGDSDSADRFPVSLRAAQGGQSLTLYQPTAYEEALACASELGRFVGLPVEDAATGPSVLRSADEVTMSLTDRMRGADAAAFATEPPPASMTSRVERTPQGVQITIPKQAPRFAVLLGTVVPIGIILIAAPHALRFFQTTNTPVLVQAIAAAFAALFFVAVPLGSVLRNRGGGGRHFSRVLASPAGVEIEERLPGSHRTRHFAAADLLDVSCVTVQALREGAQMQLAERSRGPVRNRHRAGRAEAPAWLDLVLKLVPSKGIVLKTRQGLVTFGAGLPDPELRYLHSVLLQALASTSGS